MIKAIETHYKGYRFRSRLEARWAVFFDALGISYGYEVEGFELSNGERYLPDFVLHSFFPGRSYVEVKPHADQLNEVIAYFNEILQSEESSIGLYLEGSIGEFNSNGVRIDGTFVSSTIRHWNAEPPELRELWYSMGFIPVQTTPFAFTICPMCAKPVIVTLIEGADKYPVGCICSWPTKIFIKKSKVIDAVNHPLILSAVSLARSARFEYGETPRVPRGKPRK